MEYVKANCPHCGKELQIPQDAEQIVCMYCAKPIRVATVLQTQAEAKQDGQQTGENYESLMKQAETLLNDDLFLAQNNIYSLKQNNYEKFFQDYEQSFRPALHAYSLAATEGSDAADRFAHVLFERFLKSLKQEGVKKESDPRFFDFRYLIVAYTIPAIMEYHTPAAEELADRFLAVWNEHYPKNKLGKSTFDQISNGFRKKLCFITTAVCTSLGKGDDCEELNAFRSFRDNWLAKTPEGQAKIREYYLFAPMIVNRIDQSERKERIYQAIWESSLAPCLEKIRCGENEACAKQYEQMVRELEEHWLS
ncbi:MAG TPA: hypothetical protein GXX74_10360 [Clostridiales bacterium]|nr:hypothetical protein [Clostridiales bacterium]